MMNRQTPLVPYDHSVTGILVEVSPFQGSFLGSFGKFFSKMYFLNSFRNLLFLEFLFSRES